MKEKRFGCSKRPILSHHPAQKGKNNKKYIICLAEIRNYLKEMPNFAA